MTFKKLISSTALMMMFALAAIAQHPGNILSHSEELGLTTDQVTAIEELNKANRPSKVKAKGIPRKVDHNTKPQLFKTGLEEILTEEQMSKWIEMTAMRKEERKTKRDEQQAARKATHDQRQAYIAKTIAPVVRKYRAEFDKSLSNAERETIAIARTKQAQARPLDTDSREKISRVEKKANRQALSEIVSNHKDELDAIWTDLGDQVTTWNEALAEMKPDKKEAITENREERPKNRKRGHKRGGFSHLTFVLIDY
jgi:hypothetical protein